MRLCGEWTNRDRLPTPSPPWSVSVAPAAQESGVARTGLKPVVAGVAIERVATRNAV